ncbi:hypothetical protein BGZ97_007741 [Linnemannia gamsii]|uniref:Uncharacterized protein n=1 Tax=Linnemannia gamsii TaxID=64522 RepID=A0A9P6UF15_9FUNG|nr:hypothetical protein BGZ97_007741 [Linnemannia gamsii]
MLARYLKAPTIKLYREFEQYQKNKGNLFWTQRAVQVSTAVTTNETTVVVQKAESKKAQLEYERQVVDSEKPSMENELIDDSDNSERDTESKSTSTGPPPGSASEPFEVDDTIEDVEQILLTPMKATPFYSLIQYAFNKAQGKNADLPQVPESFSTPNI